MDKRNSFLKAFLVASLGVLLVANSNYFDGSNRKPVQLESGQLGLGEYLVKPLKALNSRFESLDLLMWLGFDQRIENTEKISRYQEKKLSDRNENSRISLYDHSRSQTERKKESFEENNRFDQKSGLVSQNLLLTSRRESCGYEAFSIFDRFLPKFFVSAEEILNPSEVRVNNGLAESLNSSFLVIFCILELAFSMSHILVHLGVKNPRYRFLIKQRIYFTLDGSFTIMNLLYFWDSYFLMKPFLIYVILAHMYYVADLFLFQGKSRIFEWSSVDRAKNRFDFEYFKENLETVSDILCHFIGFLSSLANLSSVMQAVSILASFLLLWVVVLNRKFFFTKKHMMPSWLHPAVPEELDR